jgi:hypothetical protein
MRYSHDGIDGGIRMTATATATTKKTEVTPPVVVDPNRCDTKKVKVGTLWSRHSFGEVIDSVTDPTHGLIFNLRNDDGLEWGIAASVFEKEFSTADQSETTEKLSRTKVIEILKESPRTVMTVTFHKKPDHKAIAKLLSEGQGEKTTRQWNKLVKDSIAGEETVLVGYHTGAFDEHQRLYFTKVGGKLDPKRRFRLVDPRTVTKLVVGRAEYVVKAK